MWKAFKEACLESAKETCGTSKLYNKQMKKSSWWTQEIRNIIKQKEEAWRKYLKTRSTADYETYKMKRTEAKKVIIKAKEEEWIKFGHNLMESYSDNQKLFYGAIKNMSKENNSTLQNIRDKNGTILNTEEKIMERWREYFRELLEDGVKQEKEMRESEEQGATISSGQNIIIFSIEEIKKALNKLKTGKAPGHDCITAEMLKYMGEAAQEFLLKIFNEVGKVQMAPEDWQTGIITPIYKKGDSKECQNYRGITLLSVPGKLFARVLEARIREKVEDSLGESQCGFRPNRGVQDHISTMRMLIEKARRTNREIHVCFIDLEKAFDKVIRQKVWECLQAKGIDEQTLQCVKSLYKINKNYVRTRNNVSETFNTDYLESPAFHYLPG